MADHETLSLNRDSFTFKQGKRGGDGKGGGTITCCRLNKARWVTIRTPEYHEGMSAQDAAAAWRTYLNSWVR